MLEMIIVHTCAVNGDGFFYSGLAMVSLIAMNVINAFYR